MGQVLPGPTGLGIIHFRLLTRLHEAEQNLHPQWHFLPVNIAFSLHRQLLFQPPQHLGP